MACSVGGLISSDMLRTNQNQLNEILMDFLGNNVPLGNKLLTFYNYLACGFNLCPLLEAILCSRLVTHFKIFVLDLEVICISEVENVISSVIKSIGFVHCVEGCPCLGESVIGGFTVSRIDRG